MMTAGHWQALAQIFAERMLNSTVEGLAIALFGWALLRALRRQNSSTRFAVWFSALLAIATLPFVDNFTFIHSAALPLAARSAIHLPLAWAFDIFVLWAAIAGAGLVRIAFGFWRLHKLRQSCATLDPASLPPLLLNTLEKFGSARRVLVCTSDRVRVPTAMGFTKPAIILPAWVLQELSTLEINAVLLHELAHLRRWDDWTNLAQRILRALLFFHPAVWWIARGLTREREMACDDFVLASTSDPRGYAQCLVMVAEKSFLRHGIALAQAVVGRMQQTVQRVARILDADRPAATKVWKPALGLFAAFSVLCLISLSRTPRLVAFEATVPSLAATAPKVTPLPVVDSVAGARMIPAAFHSPVSSASARAKDALARTAKPQPRNRDESPLAAAISPARSLQPQTASPRLVNASADASSNSVSPPDSVLLVMQTEQVDEYGRLWSIYVWRLTVFHPMPRQAQKEVTPKST